MTKARAEGDQVDVAILIALREEFRVLRDHVGAGDWREVRDEKHGGYFYRFSAPAGDGPAYQCVVKFIGDMGEDEATHASGRLLDWDPATIVNLGIAGALSKDLLLGDVAIADQVDEYATKSKAVADEDDGWRLEFGGSVYRSTNALVAEADNFEFAHQEVNERWVTACAEQLDALVPEDARELLLTKGLLRRRLELHKVHLASGPIVGASQAFATWLRKRDRNLAALEMEAAGMMLAAHKRADPVSTLVLRGISDLGDERKSELDAIGSGGLRTYAMGNAVRFLWALMEAGLLPRKKAPKLVSTAYDLYVSYRADRSTDLDPLLAALEHRGVRVFRGLGEDRDGQAIAESVRRGLASSRALAVYAMPDYTDRLICAWELASAWIAGQAVGQVAQRVLFLRPPNVDLKQLRMGPLDDTLAFDLADDVNAVARKITDHLARVDVRPFGELAELRRPPPWYPNAREGSNHFVGRWPQLLDLHSKLSRSAAVGITGHVGRDSAQVRGLGGVGKSLLAIEYIRRMGAAWPGGVFWIDADPSWAAREDTPAARHNQRETLLAGLAASLAVLPVPGDLSATAASVVRELDRRTKDEHTGERKRYLWILDNVPANTRQRLLEVLGPPISGGTLLLTTRWRGLTGLGEHIDLDVLDADAALVLLSGRHAPVGDDEARAARQVAKAVGYHPLTLDVLRALVETTAQVDSHPYATWAARLADTASDELDAAAEALEEELPTGCARAITRVLADSFEGRSEVALDILRLAALLGEEPIPGELFCEALGKHGEVTQTQVERALAELSVRSLISMVGGAVDVHAVVRRVARHWHCEPARLDVLAMIACIALFPRFVGVLDIRTHASVEPYIPHALALVEADLGDVPALALELGNFFQIRGDYSAARDRFEQALEVSERSRGVEDPVTLMVLQNLAGTMKAQGDLVGARESEERALEASERIFGAEDLRTMKILHNLAGTLYLQGDYKGARERYERTLSMSERLLGPNHPETLSSLQNLAGTLFVQGDLKGARELGERALATSETILGPEHPDTLRTLRNLAATFLAQGDLVGAHKRLERVLSVSERILGPEHPDTLCVLQDLAITLKEQGSLGKARELEERVREARERILGPNHPDTLRTLANLAGTLLAQGDFKGGRESLERVYSAYAQILGPDHPDALRALHNLAGAYHAQGDLSAARGLEERVFEARERVLGPEHPDTLRSLQNLAGIGFKQVDPVTASDCLARVLTAQERTLGADHSDTIRTRFNLVLTLLELEPAAAIEHVRELEKLKQRPAESLSAIERRIVAELSSVRERLP